MHTRIIGLTFIGILAHLFFASILVITTDDMGLAIGLIAPILLAVLGVFIAQRRLFYGAILLSVSGGLIVSEIVIMYLTQISSFSSPGYGISGFITVFVLIVPGLLVMLAGRWSYKLHQSDAYTDYGLLIFCNNQ